MVTTQQGGGLFQDFAHAPDGDDRQERDHGAEREWQLRRHAVDPINSINGLIDEPLRTTCNVPTRTRRSTSSSRTR